MKELKRNVILMMCALTASTMCIVSCSDDDDSKSKAQYFMNFNYGSTSIAISGDDETKGNVSFAQVGNSMAITGFDINGRNLSIAVDHEIEAGKTYDIMGGTTSGAPSIAITYASIDPIVADMSTTGTGNKVGELHISEYTEGEVIKGTFHSKMMKSEITNGEFCAKYSEED